MKILIDLQACQTPGSRERGIGRYSMALALAMVENNKEHDFWLLLNSRYEEAAEAVREAFKCWVPQEQIIEFYASCDEPFLPTSASTGDARKVAKAMREYVIKKVNPDAIHIASALEGCAEHAVCSLDDPVLAKRTFITLYDLIPLIHHEIYLENHDVKRWYHEGLFNVQRARGLLAISESSRQEALAHFDLPPNRVVNISSAVDDVFVPANLDADAAQTIRQKYGIEDAYIMYTGGIDHRKNIEGLIEAYSLLPSELISENQLTIVCGIQSDVKARLLDYAKGLGLTEGRVCFTGFVPESDLVALYSECNLFVFPSLHEGFGLPALEAMGCGAPVIASNCSSLPEVVGMEDALFDPSSTRAIACAIEKGLSDFDFRQRLLANAEKRSVAFSWQKVARKALDAMQDILTADEAATVNPSLIARPKLAYVAPMPPVESGVAIYSEYMLESLLHIYDVTLVLDQPEVESIWLDCCGVISAEEFSRVGSEFERVLYQMGNSAAHAYMLPLLSIIPGVVVMHDCYLSGLMNYYDAHFEAGLFHKALFHSHGYKGLQVDKVKGRRDCVMTYPVSQPVLGRAKGIITHSKFAQTLIKNELPKSESAPVYHAPLIMPKVAAAEKSKAREALGIANDAHVIVSFGFIAESKLSHRVVEGWLGSSLTQQNSELYLVGGVADDVYAAKLDKLLSKDKRIHITGFVDDSVYQNYLAAADIAVQLRTNSRGETSAAVLECLAAGVPLIVNKHGSASELPGNVALMLPDEGGTSDVSEALNKLVNEPDLKRNYADAGKAHIVEAHSSRVVAAAYVSALEASYVDIQANAYSSLISQLKTIRKVDGRLDWSGISKDILLNSSALSEPRLVVDLTECPVSEMSKVQRASLVENLDEKMIFVTKRREGYYTAYEQGCALVGWPNVIGEEELFVTSVNDRVISVNQLLSEAGVY